jgi:hypothetical protein
MPLGVKKLVRRSFFTELDFTLKSAFFKNQEFQDFLTLKGVPKRCPQTSVQNYHSMLRKTPKEGKILFTSRRKPEITQFKLYLSVTS